MMHPRRLRVLALAPACDNTDVGEAWCAYQWVKGLSEHHDVTLLTMRRHGFVPASEQLPNVEVIEWDDLPLFHRYERLNSMLKPGYIRYFVGARRWLRHALASGRVFDVAHQFTPIALRYPSPAAGTDIPLLLGPLAGSLTTPPSFDDECGNAPWFTHLRKLDGLRLRRDPLLKRTYTDARVVIGAAPYVESLLSHLPIQRFETMSELGVYDLPKERRYTASGDGLKLVHVGRVIRTKGLRDAVRAIGALRDLPGITLESAGEGEDLEACRKEARDLGIEDRVTFHGRIPRGDVEKLYEKADAFIFPSFREPSGSVIFESMRRGLPVITTDRGGPAHVVDDSCGIRVPVTTPNDFANGLAGAIASLAGNPDALNRLSAGARDRMAKIGLWPAKIEWLSDLYRDVLRPSKTIEV